MQQKIYIAIDTHLAVSLSLSVCVIDARHENKSSCSETEIEHNTSEREKSELQC